MKIVLRENTDMVIVELELVSGYKADSPDSLLNEVHGVSKLCLPKETVCQIYHI